MEIILVYITYIKRKKTLFLTRSTEMFHTFNLFKGKEELNQYLKNTY